MKDGNHKFPWTSLPAIGEAIANALAKPGETDNQSYTIYSALKSQQEMIELAKRTLGSEGWQTSRVDVDQLFEQAMDKVKVGIISLQVIGDILRYTLSTSGYIQDVKQEDNDVLGVQVWTDDEIIQLIKNIAGNLAPLGPINDPVLQPDMLCARCDQLRLDNLEDTYGENTTDEGKSFINFERIKDFTYDFVDNAPGFSSLESAKQAGCGLCSILKEELVSSSLNNYDGEVRVSFRYQLIDFYDGPKSPGALVVTVEPADATHHKLGVAYLLSIHADDEITREWLQLTLPKPELDALSLKTLDFINDEIQGPLQQEPDLDPNFNPTRLLDLGEEDNPTIRLILTEGYQTRLKYVTLSYCWGPPAIAAGQSKTTAKTLQDRLNGISEEDLSPVILDAVKFCRALKEPIRYLWVDALCIIQGDALDWKTESGRMGSIYQNAFVTLGGLGSSSCQQSFLSRRLPSVKIDYQSHSEPSVTGSYTMMLRGEAPLEVGLEMMEPGTRCANIFQDLDIVQAAWLTRGWTFQEHHLSTRRIFIGRAGTHFSGNGYDGTWTRSEDGTQTIGPGLGISFMLKKDDWEGQLAQSGGLAEFWHKALWEYRRRALTNETDALPALSGLAKSVAEVTGARYMAGIWEHDLQVGLLWTCTMDGKDKDLDQYRPSLSRLLHDLQTKYLAPSWSPLAFRGGHPEDLLPWAYAMKVEDWDKLFDVLEIKIDIDNEGRNPYGAVRAGHVKLSASVVSLAGTRFSRESFNRDDLRNWIIRSQSNNEYVAHANLDFTPAKEDVDVDKLILLLLVGQRPDTAWSERVGLILCPAEGKGDDVYRRVGVFSINGGSWLEDNSETDAQILDKSEKRVVKVI
ncbi:HET-domain-containing [Fusarium albosuccineum]|uniref:HET-domain-containing n=1 Tax=Fusarium albosuccineum TaxID=1237068 RepID=A0A8H4LN83_9HYPO|nr:HET-domain-containing [Fusarium albosuccineum]